MSSIYSIAYCVSGMILSTLNISSFKPQSAEAPNNSDSSKRSLLVQNNFPPTNKNALTIFPDREI